MSDNPDTKSETYDPDELIDPTYGILRVTREDYDIENQLFSKHVLHTTCKRTDKDIPRYLTKADYDPKRGTAVNLSLLAGSKAERVCKRHYPEAAIRNMNRLYGQARRAFTLWWSHLEDDKFRDVDEEAVKRAYIAEFI